MRAVEPDDTPVRAEGPARASAEAQPTSRVTARPRRSLARRLFWFTVLVVLGLEALTFVPELGRERRSWLDQRVREADLAAITGASIQPDTDAASARDRALRADGLEGIRLGGTAQAVDLLRSSPDLDVRHLDFDHEPAWLSSLRALRSLIWPREGLTEITADSTAVPGARLTVGVRHAQLVAHLLQFSETALVDAVLESLLAGLLVYGALFVAFVRPMQRIVGSIHRFREDPERAPTMIASPRATRRDDEIAQAESELVAMQSELRAALWRNARLAAIGTAVAKVSHDLRGVLSPAMLAAERLQTNKDPAVSRTGDILVKAVERAVDIVRGPLDFARDGPVPPTRITCGLRDAVGEAFDQLVIVHPRLRLVFDCGPDIAVEADPGYLSRIFGNLLRNAAQADARSIEVVATPMGRQIEITVGDDAGGIPASVSERLFQPFVSGHARGSAGLGLAIVRDLVIALGGDIVVASTGPSGTTFRFTLPAAAALAVAPARAAAPAS